MSDGATDQFPKSLPVDDHFLLSPMLNDQKNKEKIKAMMERNDDDFENELDVPNPQEENLKEDWHQSFLANQDRRSFLVSNDADDDDKFVQNSKSFLECVDEQPTLEVFDADLAAPQSEKLWALNTLR